MDLDRALLASERAIMLAAEVCRAARAEGPPRVHVKADGSPVTLADLASQAVITAVLSRELGPDLGGSKLVGEEDARWLAEPEHAGELDLATRAARVALPALTSTELVRLLSRSTTEPRSERYFLVDPLDGTKGYLRGGQYCLAIALVERGRPVLGVLGCPALARIGAEIGRLHREGSLYGAVLGRGVHGRRCVAATDEVPAPLVPARTTGQSPLRLAASVEPSHGNRAALARVTSELGARSLGVDSAVKYALVARGDADLYLRLPPRPGALEYAWDHAPGALIAGEAGVRVTNLRGNPLDFAPGRQLGGPGGVLAARPELHDRVLAVLERLGIR